MCILLEDPSCVGALFGPCSLRAWLLLAPATLLPLLLAVCTVECGRIVLLTGTGINVKLGCIALRVCEQKYNSIIGFHVVTNRYWLRILASSNT